jgi:hypothetical protein
MILVVLFAGGSLICGLIAAAAVFASGAYWAAAGEDVDVSDRW